MIIGLSFLTTTALCFTVISIVSFVIATGLDSSAGSDLFDESMEIPDATDVEFLADLPDEIPHEVALKVRRAVAFSAWLDADEIWPETTMTELQQTCVHKTEPF